MRKTKYQVPLFPALARYEKYVEIKRHLTETERGGRKVFPIGTDDFKVNELQGQPIHPTITGAIGRQGSSKEYKNSLAAISNTIKARYEALGDGSYIAESKLNAPNGKEIDLSILPKQPCQLLEVRTEQGKQTRKKIRQSEGRDSTKRGKDDKKYIPNDNGLANCLTTGKENIEKWTIIP